VHSCYKIDTYKIAYAYNLVPLRGRVNWEKMNGVVVLPPLYTNVMGRPKTNGRKAPEEKRERIMLLMLPEVVSQCIAPYVDSPTTTKRGIINMCKQSKLMKMFKIKKEKDMMKLLCCSTLFLYKQTQLLILHMQEIAWYTTWAKRYCPYDQAILIYLLIYHVLYG
jgi:hypothetical protein